MLYLIGGAPRSGKSLLVRRLLAERHVPYLPIDQLMMGVARGWPDAGVDPAASDAAVGERLWPVIREMARTLLDDGLDYAIEGAQLQPAHVAAVRDLHPTAVRACFLGYADATPGKKLRAIRKHAGLPNDWIQAWAWSDAEVLAFIGRMTAHSAELRDRCAAHGLRYFEVSQDFDGSLTAALSYLTAPGDPVP
jgi:hypothetical protein